MIEVQDLVKKYGDFPAVKKLSFEVPQGKIWGLLGPNAAGKTTTMRILTGFLPATDGAARVAGIDVFERPDAAKRILGYLPENVPLYPEMTVASYLGFVAAIKQVPKAKKKEAVVRAVRSAGLETVRGRLIKNISRGFKQRVGIAQALIHDPQILILDEPTIGLDPAQIIEIRELIRSLRGERTIILSTHLLAEVTQVCDGVTIINEGRLMASGTLDELTASARSTDGVVLKLRKSGPESTAALRAIPGVDTAAIRDSEIEVAWSRGRDLREAVARTVVEKDLGLLEMKSLGMNIEDLYLKIVSGGLES
ncbi:MAG: ABC transporter ATP-binding protein [Acidobacteriota bacterium]|nr:ABC transporter ATP-binding protein [Acidobacteriota bacterium]